MILSRTTSQALRLTILIWILSGLLYVLPAHFVGEVVNAYYLATMALVCVAGVCLSVILLAVAWRVRQAVVTRRILVMVAAIALASATLAFLDAAFAGLLAELFRHDAGRPGFWMRMTNNFSAFTWQFALLGAVYAVLQTNDIARMRERQLIEARAAAGEARAAAEAARLAALRYQLNPHFLFNTLNAVSSLVVNRRNAQAEEMLSRLSGFLRNTLTSDTGSLTTVDEELTMLQSYLEVESSRFGDRLEVEFVCEPVVRDIEIPSFIMQPLVENAVKYGVARTRRKVTITIRAEVDGDFLHLSVEDDGVARQDADPVPTTGVGLRNVRERLEGLYGARAALITTAGECGFVAAIRLPLGNLQAVRGEAA
ncbi:sensor histidine kinase [Qipengyuania atrilutea]|uniref:Histidine kinase n=1 Tax=Qipengyuania atrilutea TaxID=2744473 RepID=A0A850H7Z7_9SPHN|nr:histidine kinase [Actirhodobacter atriluteus]NVD45923.1 histidine kinase [Actirhodobacter atriluteus]